MDQIKPIDAFYDITPALPSVTESPLSKNGNQYLSNVNELSVGFGSKVLRTDRQGLWLGNAYFEGAPFSVDMLGQILAAKLTVKDSNSQTIIDPVGLVSSANFLYGSASASPNAYWTNTSDVTAAGSTMTFTLPRASTVMVFLTVQSAHEQINPSANMSGRIQYTVDFNGVSLTPEVLIDTSFDWTSYERENVLRKVYSATCVTSGIAGENTIKMKYKMSFAVNLQAALYNWSLTYMILGK